MIKSDSLFVFGQAFFKRLGGAAALGGRASQGAKYSYRSKRHRRVNDKPTACQRGTAQVGGSPFYAKAILIVYPLFLLMQEAQKKKLGKKKMPQERFRRLRTATNARALDRRKPFKKGLTENECASLCVVTTSL